VSQCSALFYEKGESIGYYCVLQSSHKGAHVTDDKRSFTEAQATRNSLDKKMPSGKTSRFIARHR
jgi:hypothetical protein